MTLQPCTVSVKQLPETLDTKQRRSFLRELDSCLNVGRPCIVIDCSKVREMDRGILFLLLCCLEEAMKRHGDVRLAAIPKQAHWLMQVTGVDRLFKIFDEVPEAVSSYRRANARVLEFPQSAAQQKSANAA